jgi:WD40 repeat protein/tRNA A-37 threonylcarbamoyl transferase component Bud32
MSQARGTTDPLAVSAGCKILQADRNLLLGILAAQMDLVGRDALATAINAWMLERQRPLGEILVEQGALAHAQRVLLESLVQEHLSAHGGDAAKSLASVNANTFGSIWAVIETQVDPALHPTLSLVPSAGAADTLADPEATLPHWSRLSATLAQGPSTADSLGTRFLVIRPHARGGIGQVSVALDRELNREVALKEILPEQADNPHSRARFLLEAEVTGRLEHPGVVPVYGLGKDSSGHPFYAMRFVKGESLQDAIVQFHRGVKGAQGGLRRWVLSLRHLLNRFIAVCSVMEYAHSRGIIHRDLKPSNILLGAYGETLVVDWGLAKVVGREDIETGSGIIAAASRPAEGPGTAETLPGTAVGTPVFMSPEQADGRLDSVGPASDVYSLGASLYCLLTGQPPIHDSDIASVLQKVKAGEIISPRQANRRVPAGLEAICLKAMALHPRDRYSTPRELARDLECWMADEPVSVYREPISVRLTRWGRRHRTLATAIGVLLVTAVAALAVGTILLGWANDRTAGQRALALEQWHRAELKTREAREKADELERQLYINRVNLAQREYQDNIPQAEALLELCPPVHRGWEWYYLKRLCHLELATIQGPSLGVQTVAYSPDGKRFVSGGGKSYLGPLAEDDAELILWDTQKSREVRRFHGLKGSVHSVKFSPDGRLIAVGSGFYQPVSEGHLTLWDAATGKLLYDRKVEHLNVLSVAFSPDGKTLAAGLGNYSSKVKGRLTLWEVPGGRNLTDLALATQGGVNSVAFSKDGKTIATASSEVVELWRGDPLVKVLELKGHTNWIYTVTFSPDGNRLATGGWDKSIKLWNAKTGAQLATLEGHLGFVNDLSFSPDGGRLASVGEDHTIRLWDAASGQNDMVLRGHALGITSLAFSPDGQRILSASEDRTLKLWDATTDYQLALRDYKGWVSGVAFSPDGQRLATGSGDRSIMLWDVATGKRLLSLDGGMGWVNSVAFSPDGKYLAAAGEYQRVQIRNAATGALIQTIEHLDTYVRVVAFSPDGTLLAACTGAHGNRPGPPGVVYVWNATTREQVNCFRGHAERVLALAFSPDSKLIASGGSPQSSPPGTPNDLLVWEARTGQVVQRLRGHTGAINCLAFSPGGQWLASGGEDGYVRIWDLKTGALMNRFQGLAKEVVSLAFHPDGTRLATGTFARNIELFDPATGEKILTLPGHAAGVVGLTFSPDGRHLASGSVDWTARIWEAAEPNESPR